MKKTLHAFVYTLSVLIVVLCAFTEMSAQGCVAIRGLSGCTGNVADGIIVPKGDLLLGTNFRYFKSFRHFRGEHEETNRVEDGTEVVNHSYFLDLSATYGISDRWYANIILPFVHHSRSSMYEHGGNPPNGLGERHETSTTGIADLRFGAGYWLFNPENHSKFNYAFGLGLKLPSGNYKATDTFYNQGAAKDTDEEKVVDQSIQPGDGGYGITTEIQGFHAIGHHFMLLTNLYYLINPQQSNGVLTRNGKSEFSCPDQYAARVGTFYLSNISGLSGFLGARLEGVPATDLIGSSAGYRRPGFAISVEPGAGFSFGNASLNLTIPFALYRNRTQSYEDKERTKETGVYRHGDAAFADYLINFSFSYRLGGKDKAMEMHAPGFNEFDQK